MDNNGGGGVVDVAALEQWAKSYVEAVAKATGSSSKQSTTVIIAERTLKEALAFARRNARGEAKSEVLRG